MEYLLDTANIEKIKKYYEYLPIDGVTSNPTIIKNEGSIDFFRHMKEIREIIGYNSTLHVQVTSEDYHGMLKDADAIIKNIDDKVYIKVPTTMEGLKVIKKLKSRELNVTATAIYTINQCYLAIKAGADYIAPYFNRMENININPDNLISEVTTFINRYSYNTKILAASFKNIGQVNRAIYSGAGSVTLDPLILENALKMPDITEAVKDFSRDWSDTFGNINLKDM